MDSLQGKSSFLSILQCEKCGSNKLFRRDDYFVCPYCGTYYLYDTKCLDIQQRNESIKKVNLENENKKSEPRERKIIIQDKEPIKLYTGVELPRSTNKPQNKNTVSLHHSPQGKLSSQQKEKIIQIANENDESGLEDIVSMLHVTRPDRTARKSSIHSFQNRIIASNCEDSSAYISFLYAIYEYAKRTCSQLRHAIIAESRHGRYTASIILPEFTKETRRVQDLLIFAGITKDINTVSKPIGCGTIISARRQKTLQVYLDKVKEICASDQISIDFHIELKAPDIQHFFRCELPFQLKATMEYPDQVHTRAIITGTYNNAMATEKHPRTIEINRVDSMTGTEFENFCAELLQQEGFSNISITKGSHDQGIDIIATNGMVKYGFQCKCYVADVGNSAIQEANAGRTFYECHIGVVITNRYFTSSAKELAKRLGIILWDRDYLCKRLDSLAQNNSKT